MEEIIFKLPFWTRSLWARFSGEVLHSALIALLVLPLLFFGIQEIRNPESRAHPVADNAVIELELAQIPDHWPTTGSYSRFEFHHPGPSAGYLLLPSYLIGQRHSVAINLGALWVNILALGISLWLLRGWTTRGLLSGTIVGLLAFRFLSSILLTSPWGPYLSVLPLAAMIALTARFRRDEPGSWLLAALLGGFLIQLHVLFVPVCGLLVVAAVLMPPGAGVNLSRRWFLVLGAMALLLWFPLLADLARGSESNAMAMLHFFQKPFEGEDSPLRFMLGAQAATSWLLSQVGIIDSPYPNRAHVGWEPADASAVWIALIAQMVLGAWLVVSLSRKEEARSAFRLTMAALVLSAWGLLAVLRIRGPLFPYLLVWLTPATVTLWGVGIWHGWGLIWRWRWIRSLTVAVGLMIASFAVVGILTDDQSNREGLPRPRGLTVAEVAARIIKSNPKVMTQGVHIAGADHKLWLFLTGLVLELKKADVEATVSHSFSLMMPPCYLDVLPDKPTLWLTREPEPIPGLPLLDQVDGINILVVDESSVHSWLAFGSGWDRETNWGRGLRAKEGQIIADFSGSATLHLEVSNTKEMTDGQNVTILENGREVWSGHIEVRPWSWTPLEIPLSTLSSDGRRNIQFICERNYPIADTRVLPLNLLVRHLKISRGS